ncbi:GTPase HflX [Rhizobium albus]|nr:GTPase HflX [Rhizobium albus]
MIIRQRDKDEKADDTPKRKLRDDKRAFVLVPILKRDTRGDKSAAAERSDEARLEEANGLTRAIDLEIAHATVVSVAKPQPATLLGSGKVEEIGGLLETLNAGLVIVDHPLTPVQQRNLEREWHAKVIDRTGLILEIFGSRASTREGVLQVELAHLNYQKGRLVRSWTHLERQRGSTSFIGGPGETQIEADRRILQDKIIKLERELEQVRRTRQLHRAKRKKVPHPIVALVGYTNAGKSTLFNSITGASVMAQDMLFATLDPTLRRMKLPKGRAVILSDTVGFISNLPTHLVAAFRATLEEVLEADLVLHVRDIADPDTGAQAEDVRAILEQLGLGGEDAISRAPIIEVWNKIDRLEPEAATAITEKAAIMADTVVVSAITGEGVNRLLSKVEEALSGQTVERQVVIGTDDQATLSWLYEHANIRNRVDNDDGTVLLDVEITEHDFRDFEIRLSNHSEE